MKFPVNLVLVSGQLGIGEESLNCGLIRHKEYVDYVEGSLEDLVRQNTALNVEKRSVS